MKGIPIFNPSPLGKAFVAPKRAAEYIRKGRAIMRQDGSLQFTLASQAAFLAMVEKDRVFEESAREHRAHGMFYWNGVFTDPPNKPGFFSFPPGCNVHYRRPGARYNSKRRDDECDSDSSEE